MIERRSPMPSLKLSPKPSAKPCGLYPLRKHDNNLVLLMLLHNERSIGVTVVASADGDNSATRCQSRLEAKPMLT